MTERDCESRPQEQASIERLERLRISLLIAVALVSPAVAQDSNSQSDLIEEIIVTGSRFERDPNLGAALPVQTVTREQIRMAGEFEVSDIVNDLPALAASSTSEQSFGSQGDTGINTNVLTLRALGPNRTLVLVNGRRHVPGQPGTSAVDIGSIPSQLIERVEVLTGGASAIYGADAVTGVVNFILRDDFDGLSIDASAGISAEGDGEQLTLSAAWGTGFASERGSIAIALDYQDDSGVWLRDRPGENFATARPLPNPALRFQQGDIDPAATPNLAQFFGFSNTGLFHYGLTIPAETDFIAAFNDRFGVDPTLTDVERALFARAAAAPPLALLDRATFHITSPYGRIIPGNPYTFQGFDPSTPIDLDGNGTPDCLDSFTGYNSSFAPAALGIIGGCWAIDAAGGYAPVRNGLIAEDAQGFGGDSFDQLRQDADEIIFPSERLTFNLLGRFDVSDRLSLFAEAKYSTQDFADQRQESSFWDNLFGAADNPYLPEFIQPIAAATGGVAITVDPTYNDPSLRGRYKTARAVIGATGDLGDSWNYEISLNYGRFDSRRVDRNEIIVDRWFAAIDAVSDPGTGEPVCRSEVDPNAPLVTTPFNFPRFDPGYFSFTPGSGQCLPLNIWQGRAGISDRAMDWVTADVSSESSLDQFVVTAFARGDSSGWLDFPGGPLQLLAGIEYRDESSKDKLDPLLEGFLPSGSPFAEGTNIADVSANGSVIFPASFSRRAESGDYDVADVFFEVLVPLAADRPWIREFSLEAALRYSDYSTIGTTTTWKTNITYAPVHDLVLRGGISRAVRAPNISELFSPEASTGFFVFDPCEVFFIDALAQSDPTLAQQTQANCVAAFEAIGLDPFDSATGDYAFVSQSQGLIPGVASGNPDLREESADTVTIGLVLQPTAFDDFSVTVDYWQIEIDDAIENVRGDAIVEGCYVGANLNPAFCPFTSRNNDPTSIFFGALEFIRATNVNFASLDASGVDFDLRYRFNIGAHELGVNVAGTRLISSRAFDNPLDPTAVNSFASVGGFQKPEWAGNVFLDWSYGDVAMQWQSRYTGEQILPFAEPDSFLDLFGPSVKMNGTWVHDLAATWQLADSTRLYAGIRNLADERPFITEIAYPASARGRFFFAGIELRLD